MLLFKTSAKTFDSVITNEKHAFFHVPKGWIKDEIALISKNKTDCRKGENQIQYITYLDTMRPTTHAEIEKYWPNNFGRWKYIADCYGTIKLKQEFNLGDIIDENEITHYKNITPAMKITIGHEQLIYRYLQSIKAFQ